MTFLSKAQIYFSHALSPVDALLVSKGFFRPNASAQIPSNPPPTIAHEIVNIPTPDGLILNGYFFPATNPTKNTIIFFHGRSGTINHHYPDSVRLQNGIGNVGKDVNALIFDYRGYGNSTKRKITRPTSLIDARASFDYIYNVKKIPGENISLVGHSVGGAIVLGLANKLIAEGKRINSIIVAATFLSPKEAARATMPQIGSLKLLLISNSLLNPETLIPNIGNIPVTIIHGMEDDYFPAAHSQRLFSLARGDKELILIPGAKHRNLLELLRPSDYEKISRHLS